MFVEIIVTRLILVYAYKFPCDAFGFATFVLGFAPSGQALKTIFRLEIICITILLEVNSYNLICLYSF